MWRGVKEEVDRRIDVNDADLMFSNDTVDCVWDFSCKSDFMITLVCIRVGQKGVSFVVEREIDRVINTDGRSVFVQLNKRHG